MIKKIRYYFNEDKKLLVYKILFKLMSNKLIRKIIPTRLWLKIEYYIRLNKDLNLSNPKTFNEKLQWLKIHDRNPKYTQWVDKFEVRKYIAETIGEEYLIPLIGAWDKFEEIDFSRLPNQFVLKCTHDSGGVFICKDKSKFNIESARKKINKLLKRNYYYHAREWPYKNIKPRIIAEKYMVDESEKELKDYKIFCFNGEPKIIQVDYNRFEYHKRNIYDLEWNYIEAKIKYPNDDSVIIDKPAKLNEMIILAKKLSKNIPHVRVDFYSIYNDLYFGEMTFYHGSGFEYITPKELSKEMGNWINLPPKYERD